MSRDLQEALAWVAHYRNYPATGGLAGAQAIVLADEVTRLTAELARVTGERDALRTYLSQIELRRSVGASMTADDREVSWEDLAHSLAVDLGRTTAERDLRLDLRDPALRDRLARWSFDSERLGLTQDARDKTWEWPELAYQREQHYAFVDALLAELGRGTG